VWKVWIKINAYRILVERTESLGGLDRLRGRLGGDAWNGLIWLRMGKSGGI
jgi:hypothetical protein